MHGTRLGRGKKNRGPAPAPSRFRRVMRSIASLSIFRTRRRAPVIRKNIFFSTDPFPVTPRGKEPNDTSMSPTASLESCCTGNKFSPMLFYNGGFRARAHSRARVRLCARMFARVHPFSFVLPSFHGGWLKFDRS